MKKAIAIPPTKMMAELDRLCKQRIKRIAEEKNVTESIKRNLRYSLNGSIL